MVSGPNTILVVDDDREVAADHARLLRDIGYNPITQSVPEDVEPHLQRHPDVDLVLLDIKMPGLNGIELLHRIKVRRPDIGVVMATVVNDVEEAVRAIKDGAYNYLLKPLRRDPLERVLKSYFSNQPKAIVEDPRFRPVITQDPAFLEIFRRVKAFAEADVPMLILGETGTGKELIARLIHSLSARSQERFFGVNMAAIPANLFESELFGHARGAFTGATQDRSGCLEQAGAGTLFLDEIGELPEEQQRKLLRVLQFRQYSRVGENSERELSARIVIATNRDLRKEVTEKRFRDDLYYRIANYAITLPPLRERRGDVKILAEYFLKKYSSQFGRSIENFSKEALEALERYSFPGNVRELEGIVSSAILLEEGPEIRVESLPKHLLFDANAASGDGSELERAKCQTILRVLSECGGNQGKAAERLGISRQTLNYQLRDYKTRGWIS